MLVPELTTEIETSLILGVPIGLLTMDDAIKQVNQWVAEHSKSCLVAFANAHMVVEAQLHTSFYEVMQRMDLICADGAPIYWLVRKKRGGRVDKIAGPEFMPSFCRQSVALGHRHFIYGGAPGVAEEAIKQMEKLYPGIKVVGHHSPPFRKLTALEIREIASKINECGADLVWVCLGCPKQEEWMSEISPYLDGKVLLAVGQAVDIMAGRKKRAPAILTKLGVEWLYRFVQEPQRLWRRYLVTNLIFILLVLREKLDNRLDA